MSAGPEIGRVGRVTVLSPHPDDAVFSAWHALRIAPPATVITVFCGVPAEGTVTSLDHLHGAVDSATWVRRRQAEDRAALTSIPADPVQLTLLDAQYRAEGFPALRLEIERAPEQFVEIVSSWPRLRVQPAELEVALSGALPSSGRVYAPLGVGGHTDHVDVGAFAVELARRGRDVWLYADSPYFLQSGLPSRVGGVPNEGADRPIAEAFECLGLDVQPAPMVVRLTVGEVRQKLRTLRMYRTEFGPVDESFGGIASDPELMCYEAYWRIPGEARG